MKFINSGTMDFEIPRAKVGNYFYGNIIIPVDKMIYFEFPSELQDEDFYIQKMTFDSNNMTYSFVTVLTLSNTYKNDGFFEDHDLATDLDVGEYRILAGDYYSASLISAKVFDTSELLDYNTFIDNNNETFVDNNNEELIEIL